MGHIIHCFRSLRKRLLRANQWSAMLIQLWQNVRKPGVKSLVVDKPGLRGGEANSLSYFSDNLSVKAVAARCLLELAQIDRQEMRWWGTLGCASAVSCVNAETNSQVTDLPSGPLISRTGFPLVDLSNRSSSLPQFVTGHSLMHLTTKSNPQRRG